MNTERVITHLYTIDASMLGRIELREDAKVVWAVLLKLAAEDRLKIASAALDMCKTVYPAAHKRVNQAKGIRILRQNLALQRVQLLTQELMDSSKFDNSLPSDDLWVFAEARLSGFVIITEQAINRVLPRICVEKSQAMLDLDGLLILEQESLLGE